MLRSIRSLICANPFIYVLVTFRVDFWSVPENLCMSSKQRRWWKGTFGSQKRRSMPCWHRTMDLGLSSSNSWHTTWNTKVCPHSRRQASCKQTTAHCPSPATQDGFVVFHGEWRTTARAGMWTGGLGTFPWLQHLPATQGWFLFLCAPQHARLYFFMEKHSDIKKIPKLFLNKRQQFLLS